MWSDDPRKTDTSAAVDPSTSQTANSDGQRNGATSSQFYQRYDILRNIATERTSETSSWLWGGTKDILARAGEKAKTGGEVLRERVAPAAHEVVKQSGQRVSETSSWLWGGTKDILTGQEKKPIESNSNNAGGEVAQVQVQTTEKRKITGKTMAIVGGGIVAGAAAIAATPFVLGAAGFGAGGIVAGSAAAAAQSAIYGGATTGIFSTLTSIGAAGVSTTAIAAGAGVGGTAAGVVAAANKAKTASSEPSSNEREV